jgi:FeS assembly SUF system protein
MSSYNIIKKDGKVERVVVDSSDVEDVGNEMKKDDTTKKDNLGNKIENKTDNKIEEEVENKSEQPKTEDSEKPQHNYPKEVVKEEVIKVLKMCFDPEIPVNIYDLGLIYDVKIAENNDVLVIMTLTSPSCPVAGTLPGEVEEKLKNHPMVHDAKVHITFEPPWDMNKMSEEAKLELGFL